MTEKLAKNQTHNQQRKQRRQNAPGHSQNGTLILLLKITFHQFLKKELVFLDFYFKVLQHGFSLVGIQLS
jgi:hypothetical protein